MHGEYSVSDMLKLLFCEMELCIRNKKLDSWLDRLKNITLYYAPFFADSLLDDDVSYLCSQNLSGDMSNWPDDCRKRFHNIQYILKLFVEKSSK